ncbi:MAG: hypothetical protein ACRCVX_02305 [Shewanella sp.]
MENLTLDQCISITDKFGKSVGMPEYGQKIRGRIEHGISFIFTGRKCFVVLTPSHGESSAVHVDIAYSESGINFNSAINWVIKKALEIGATHVTFHTKNVKLERIAHKLGWQNCGVENGFSKWKFEAR